MDRVNEVVHQIVAERLERLSDPRLELVTITGAEVTADLSYATVYFAALGAAGSNGDPERLEHALGGLESASGVLRAAVAAEARLRQTPELRFVPDPAIADGARIEEILHSIREEGGFDD